MFKITSIISVAAVAALLTGCGAKTPKPQLSEQERKTICEKGVSGDFDGNLICSNLTSTEQFKNLKSVSGNLIFEGSFQNVDGLENLTEVEGNFLLRSDSLENLNGLKNLENVGRNVETKMDSVNVGGGGKMERVSFQTSKRFEIYSQNLRDISGLNNLELNGVTNFQIANPQAIQVKMNQNSDICQNMKKRTLVLPKTGNGLNPIIGARNFYCDFPNTFQER